MSAVIWLAPRLFWLLLLLPAAVGFRWLEVRRRRRDRKKFSDPALFRRMNPELSSAVSGWRPVLFGLGYMLLVLAAARPAGEPVPVEETLTRTGVDIMLVVDLSASMKATDLEPNRMQAAKAALKEFVGRLTTDRIGLTVFSGTVTLQSPLTLDYRTATMMMDIINTDFLPADGTVLGDALIYALEKIGKEDRKRAVIVLLTDGENTRGTEPLEAVKKVKEAGTKVYTVGLGTPGGARIPDGLDEFGRVKYKMYMGQPVVTQLDEETLKRIAEETGGRYYLAQSNQGLAQAYDEIRRLTQTVHTEKKKTYRYREYYLWFLIPALFLLILETLLAGSKWGRKEKTRAVEHA